MLDLDSPKWKELRTFFGESENIPKMIKEWENSIGTDKESELWREIYECVWHQNSVETAAFAVVPYVVKKLKNASNERKIDYVVDLGFIEADRSNRLEEIISKELFDDYKNSVENCKKYAVECLEIVSDKITFRYVLGAIASLFNHSKLGEILFNLDCVCEECPKCGECVYPSEIQESEYV